ncbi:leucine-rich repeat and transmembrane domain-containing protein 1 [Callorhinchus milii]|uniref:Leucine rich repeats and transmembrane domains 1 n=1 Tax=Callorhinchus milii TaxID=7868 RepID=A0A4W3GZS2_CALMI|nr:leucine-rich repeat and transmembrane domain-containing protein 1 [Callorhinchus milii]
MKGEITFGILLFVLVQSVTGCPEECLCNITLKEVNCTDNGLRDVPKDVPSDTETLYLQNNHIQAILNTAFADMAQLQILDLSNNMIERLPSDAFNRLSNLQNLNLANNSIHSMDNRTLHPIQSLKKLDLSFNNLTSLPEGLFKNLRNLTWLAVHQNQLQQIDRSILDSLSNLQVLLLQQNHWLCDCKVNGLKLWLERFLYKGGQIDEILCAEPEDLRSQDLMKIPHEMYRLCSSAKNKSSRANTQTISDHRSSPAHNTLPVEEDGDDNSDCAPKPKPQPVNLRYAIATVIITGIICGIVCLMMLAAAIYGCGYAAIMAKYHRELKKVECLGESTKEKEPLGKSPP